jgi:hypothetical protein
MQPSEVPKSRPAENTPSVSITAAIMMIETIGPMAPQQRCFRRIQL